MIGPFSRIDILDHFHRSQPASGLLSSFCFASAMTATSEASLSQSGNPPFASHRRQKQSELFPAERRNERRVPSILFRSTDVCTIGQKPVHTSRKISDSREV